MAMRFVSPARGEQEWRDAYGMRVRDNGNAAERSTAVKAWYAHIDSCRECVPGTVCRVGAAILERACNETAARMLPPPPFELIDLDAHERACTRCRPNAYCAAGRELVKRGRAAILDAGKRLVRA